MCDGQRTAEPGYRFNPSEWIEWLEEPVPGYPGRPFLRNEEAVQDPASAS